MPTRSLNRVMLIGNLTQDPNLRYTPKNTAVCSFSIATNRSWSSADGEREERVEFHNIVAWANLAEICDQILGKGDQVYVEGRLQTSKWTDDDDKTRRTTEIVINNMILLTSRSGKFKGDDNGGSSKSSKRSGGQADEPDFDDAVSDAEDVADDVPF